VKVGQILRVADSKSSLKRWVGIAEEMTLRGLQDKIRWASKSGKGDDELEEDDQELENTITRKVEMNEKQNKHFDKAVAIMKKRFPNASMGEIMDMLAMNYMSTNVRDDEGGIVVELDYILQGLEEVFGVSLSVKGRKKSSAKPVKKKKKKKKAG
jgi:hypothetical protein